MAMFAVYACQGEVDEYSSHGRGVQTGKPYNNRYVSVIRIHDPHKLNSSAEQREVLTGGRFDQIDYPTRVVA
jgi:hypothetical protein